MNATSCVSQQKNLPHAGPLVVAKVTLLHRETKDGHYISCIGIHSEHIELHDSYIYRAGFANNKNVYCFWLKNENEPENDTVECASGNSSDSKQFIGYKLLVMLVK